MTIPVVISHTELPSLNVKNPHVTDADIASQHTTLTVITMEHPSNPNSFMVVLPPFPGVIPQLVR